MAKIAVKNKRALSNDKNKLVCILWFPKLALLLLFAGFEAIQSYRNGKIML